MFEISVHMHRFFRHQIIAFHLLVNKLLCDWNTMTNLVVCKSEIEYTFFLTRDLSLKNAAFEVEKNLWRHSINWSRDLHKLSPARSELAAQPNDVIEISADVTVEESFTALFVRVYLYIIKSNELVWYFETVDERER